MVAHALMQIQQMKEEELQEMRHQLAHMGTVICQHHDWGSRALAGAAEDGALALSAMPEGVHGGEASGEEAPPGATEQWAGLEKRLAVYLDLLQQRLVVLNKVITQPLHAINLGKALVIRIACNTGKIANCKP